MTRDVGMASGAGGRKSQINGRSSGINRFASTAVIALATAVVIIVPGLPGRMVRLPPSPVPSVREWLAQSASARADLRGHGDGLTVPLSELVSTAFSGAAHPSLPDFAAAGLRAAAASAQDRSLLVLLEPAAREREWDTPRREAIVLTVMAIDMPPATFDTFGNSRPLGPGAVSYCDLEGHGGGVRGGGLCSLAFTQPGLLWALEGPDAAALEELRSSILSAPPERIDWHDL